MDNVEINNNNMDNNNINPNEKAYIETLNIHEKEIYELAKAHLGSSFDLKKSIGFINHETKK
jgi:hypothetical protein